MSTLVSLFDRPVAMTETQKSYQDLLEQQPSLRRRDQAAVLAVSEAVLIEQQCGVRSIRLDQRFGEMLKVMPSLGYIMTLTRNESAVHERKGIYDNIRVSGPMGLVIAKDRSVDLRVMLMRWKFGFAVMETLEAGPRFSLQFFDQTGTAIQKVFLQPESLEQGYQDLVTTYRAEEQEGELDIQAEVEAPVYAADEDVDADAFRSEWLAMTDVHQFFGMLRRHKISREQAFRLLGAPHAEAFDVAHVERVLEAAAASSLSIMCFVGNSGLVQIHTGAITTVKRVGPWLNILDPEFNLHLLDGQVNSAWVVRKPTEDGVITSLELYDAAGETIAQFFGERVEGTAENKDWRELAESVLAESQAA